MCGIIGIFNLDNKKINESILKEKTDILSHRGPDDWGVLVDKNIGLGFRRLSIIDLSDNAHQPMSNEDASIWLVFNGEIYNYLELKEDLKEKGHNFKSKSDAEVVLHAFEEYGENCVNLFNGMWSFIIWDKENDLLFCSRDRFGIKPFYYYKNNKMFVCASEIKALLAFNEIDRKENSQRIYEFIVYGYSDQTDETMFKDILQLKAGHNLTLKNGKVTVCRYWDLEDKVNKYDCVLNNDTKLYDQFRELLFSAVNLHLRSDVGVWTLLSGGLDSSSLVSIQRQMQLEGKVSSTIRTVTLVHEKKEINEFEYVQEIVDSLNVTNLAVACNENDFVGSMEKVIYTQDEPFAQMVVFNHYFLMRRLAQEKIKVVLSGQGVDECLCGYLPLLFSYYLSDLLRSGKVLKSFKEFNLYLRKYSEVRFFHTLTSFLMQIFKAGVSRKYASFIKARYLEKSLNFVSKDYKSLDRRMNLFGGYKNNFSTLNNHLYRMLLSDSLPKILHLEDRNSMAFSIEERLPFLDYRLVEFIFSLSNTRKYDNGVTKNILRESLQGVLPEKIRRRSTKLGFNAPEEDWARSDGLRDYLESINYERFLSTGVVDRDRFVKEYTEFRNKGLPYRDVIWRVINYIIWKKVYGII
jgi:asparagine synthase (glutamine-hydrolysing)